jgi:hypothetical protein
MQIAVIIMLSAMACISSIIAVCYMADVIDTSVKGADGRFNDSHGSKFSKIGHGLWVFWLSLAVAAFSWISVYYVGGLPSAITIQTVIAPPSQFIKAPPPCTTPTPEKP